MGLAIVLPIFVKEPAGAPTADNSDHSKSQDGNDESPFLVSIDGEGVAVPTASSSSAEGAYDTVTQEDTLTTIHLNNRSDEGPPTVQNSKREEVPQNDELQTARQILSELYQFWKRNKSLTLLCFAMGVRLGGGYIWSAYTSVYFSDFWLHGDQDCTYSYDENAALSVGMFSQTELFDINDYDADVFGSSGFVSRRLADGICPSDYPFCVNKNCQNIAETPWHNTGNICIFVINMASK
jgi:hypothetical protein